uniref:NADH-ubiquinone oxidoreductase chain 6 n=1 Tax=Elateroidea sp. 10 KM-2017 TaxID=2219424 RepID=A0A346RH00_9COLE|nr:NADH dehydrogenase subunit 6 [Elateroidea sp. 10 KM-2017]
MMMLIVTSLIFITSNHPLSMGLTLLLQTIIIALITGMMSINFWFSYILFLIMIGGMMVLFIYMTSVASNKKFKFSLKMMIMIIATMIVTLMIKSNELPFSLMEITHSMTNSFMFKQSLNKFFMSPSNWIFIMLINYLLITLIAVVKISMIKYGPLRKK